MRILLYLCAMVLMVLGIGLVVDPWRQVNALALPDHALPIAPLDLTQDDASDDVDDLPSNTGRLRIELVGPERLEMGDRDLPLAWVAFDNDAVSDCAQLAPTPIAAMDHDLAGG